MSRHTRWIRHEAHPGLRFRAQLNLEGLESRIVPFNLSGGAWLHPAVITISFVPDGTNLGSVSSNLFATFNAKFGSASTWQNVILKAAQTWAQQSNLNLSVVSDNGSESGSGAYQQGDPGAGDIRIGGFNFGTGDLAAADYPTPINNFSIAGDINFNTGQSFNINGQDYDLQTVALHEFGHALGLAHTTVSGSAMIAGYGKVRKTLGSDDVSGIRSLYSAGQARSPDRYDFPTHNNTYFTASDLTSLVSPTSLIAAVSSLDITTTSDYDWYKATAPAGTNGTLSVTVQSQGFSLLSPSVWVFDSNVNQLGYATGAGQYGTTVTATVTGISAGSTYYVGIAGSESTAMGTGSYALTMNFGPNANPVIPLPNTQTLDGFPLNAGGGSPMLAANSPAVETAGRDVLNPSEGHVAVAAAPSASPPPLIQLAAAAAQAPQAALLHVAASGDNTALQLGVGPSVTPPLQARIDSGSATDNSDGPAVVLDPQSEPAALPQAQPAPPAIPDSSDDSTAAGAALWRDACTSCFSETPVQATSKTCETPEGEGAGLLDPGAAASVLAVALGGYWGGQSYGTRQRRAALVRS
jgi:hypothetical protein